MSEHFPHALVVKTHWKSGVERLREQLRTSQQDAEKKATEPRDAFAIRAGIEAYVARTALDLVDEILKAAQDAEGALPIRLTLGHHLVIDGKVLRVINAWEETEATDGRKRWGIVTEAPKHEAAAQEACQKCRRAYDPTNIRFDGQAQHRGMPFCRECVDRCHDTEIADHWCAIDQYRQDRAWGGIPGVPAPVLADTPAAYPLDDLDPDGDPGD